MIQPNQSDIVPALQQAMAKIPETVPRMAAADLILTLFFWRALSRQWRLLSQTTPATNHTNDEDAGAKQPRFTFNEHCLFQNMRFRVGQPLGEEIRGMLFQWHRAQPQPEQLDLILRPDRFGRSGEHFLALHQPGVLDGILALIGNIDCPLPLPNYVFSQILQDCGEAKSPLPETMTTLFAGLLNPLAGETILDLACHDGGLLLACAEATGKQDGGQQSELHGEEYTAAWWALANMRLILAQQSGFRIQNERMDNASGQLADVVICDAREPKGSIQAVNLPKGKQKPAYKRPLELAWRALQTMKPVSGRMVLLLPNRLLTTADGSEFVRQLCEKKWLDAIVFLPKQNGLLPQGEDQNNHHWLLLIRQNNTSGLIAYISRNVARYHGPQKPMPFVGDTILDALKNAFSDTCHPHCILVENDIIQQRFAAYAAWLEPALFEKWRI